MFKVGEGRVYYKDNIRCLGVMIDGKLFWNEHADYVSQKGKQWGHRIGTVYRLTCDDVYGGDLGGRFKGEAETETVERAKGSGDEHADGAAPAAGYGGFVYEEGNGRTNAF